MVGVTPGAEHSLALDLHCMQGLLCAGGSCQSGEQGACTCLGSSTLQDWPSLAWGPGQNVPTASF